MKNKPIDFILIIAALLLMLVNQAFSQCEAINRVNIVRTIQSNTLENAESGYTKNDSSLIHRVITLDHQHDEGLEYGNIDLSLEDLGELANFPSKRLIRVTITYDQLICFQVQFDQDCFVNEFGVLQCPDKPDPIQLDFEVNICYIEYIEDKDRKVCSYECGTLDKLCTKTCAKQLVYMYNPDGIVKLMDIGHRSFEPIECGLDKPYFNPNYPVFTDSGIKKMAKP